VSVALLWFVVTSAICGLAAFGLVGIAVEIQLTGSYFNLAVMGVFVLLARVTARWRGWAWSWHRIAGGALAVLGATMLSLGSQSWTPLTVTFVVGVILRSVLLLLPASWSLRRRVVDDTVVSKTWLPAGSDKEAA
jgi:hypothetical protein